MHMISAVQIDGRFGYYWGSCAVHREEMFHVSTHTNEKCFSIVALFSISQMTTSAHWNLLIWHPYACISVLLCRLTTCSTAMPASCHVSEYPRLLGSRP